MHFCRGKKTALSSGLVRRSTTLSALSTGPADSSCSTLLLWASCTKCYRRSICCARSVPSIATSAHLMHVVCRPCLQKSEFLEKAPSVNHLLNHRRGRNEHSFQVWPLTTTGRRTPRLSRYSCSVEYQCVSRSIFPALQPNQSQRSHT
jgi:hypothetical protein